MDKRFAIFAIAVVGGLVALAVVNLLQAERSASAPETLTYSRFLDSVEEGEVRSVAIRGQDIAGTLDDGSRFRTVAADDPDLVTTLRENGVSISAVAAPAPSPSTVSLLTSILPLLLLVGLAIFFMSRMSGGNRTGKFGKSRAKLQTDAEGRVTFADVAGVEEAKDSLQEIVEFLRDPQKCQRLGGRIPRGVLLVGPPGSGKTLLARAVAGEANVPFFTISGSDFVEMFVGIGASRVRDLFEQAKRNAPCIIFMDEIDAVGRHRGAGLGQGNDEREQTLNALLVELDGFQSNEGIILIAATNRPDILDPALIRPGRFDREVVVGNPDVHGRERILGVHVRNVPLAPDVDLKFVARGTSGFSGADLMNLVNEAALLAARRQKGAVGRREFEDAKDKVTMGDERRTQAMTEDEKRLTAYREGGRAIVALHVPAADPIHKVTIIPRGRSVGMLKQLPEHDQIALSFRQMIARLAILMAGRAAEEIVFGRDLITSGTAGDIEEATKLARSMVTRWGLSEKMGAITYEENQEEVFLGHSVARQQNVSEQDARLITEEIRRLVDGALATAKAVLAEHAGDLELIARGLLEYETLSGDEVRDLLLGRSPVRVTEESPASAAGLGRSPETPASNSSALPVEPQALA